MRGFTEEVTSELGLKGRAEHRRFGRRAMGTERARRHRHKSVSRVCAGQGPRLGQKLQRPWKLAHCLGAHREGQKAFKEEHTEIRLWRKHVPQSGDGLERRQRGAPGRLSR